MNLSSIFLYVLFKKIHSLVQFIWARKNHIKPCYWVNKMLWAWEAFRQWQNFCHTPVLVHFGWGLVIVWVRELSNDIMNKTVFCLFHDIISQVNWISLLSGWLEYNSFLYDFCMIFLEFMLCMAQWISICQDIVIFVQLIIQTLFGQSLLVWINSNN